MTTQKAADRSVGRVRRHTRLRLAVCFSDGACRAFGGSRTSIVVLRERVRLHDGRYEESTRPQMLGTMLGVPVGSPGRLLE
jgi:hypothetical protein